MSYIDLYSGNRLLGRFDIPQHVTGKDAIYRLYSAVKTGGNGVVFLAAKMNTDRSERGKILQLSSYVNRMLQE